MTVYTLNVSKLNTTGMFHLKIMNIATHTLY